MHIVECRLWICFHEISKRTKSSRLESLRTRLPFQPCQRLEKTQSSDPEVAASQPGCQATSTKSHMCFLIRGCWIIALQCSPSAFFCPFVRCLTWPFMPRLVLLSFVNWAYLATTTAVTSVPHNPRPPHPHQTGSDGRRQPEQLSPWLSMGAVVKMSECAWKLNSK